MFCTQCGTATAGEAKFCGNCGKPIQGASSSSTLAASTPQIAEASVQQSSGNGAKEIPGHILESIKKFEDHQTVTCLECGYNGMMGVKANIVPWYVSWWTISIVIVVFAIFGGAGFVFGLVLGLLRLAFVKHLVVCPNCNSELTTK